jgi:tRNA methyl transferase
VPVASLTRDEAAGTIRVVLEGSARGVARGQSMVVYRGTRVLGEGTIDETGR